MKKSLIFFVFVVVPCVGIGACKGCGSGAPVDQSAEKLVSSTHRVPDVPSVTNTVPAKGAKDVEVNAPLTVTFSVDMDPSSINEKTICLYLGKKPVEGNVSYKNRVATFTVKSNLEYGKSYVMLIRNSVKSSDGANAAKDYAWTFETNRSFSPVLKVRIDGAPIYSDMTGYDFNTVDVGSASQTVSFTLKNEGTADLSIRSISLSGDSDQFQIISAALPERLEVQQEMIFSAKFKPTSAGTKSALVRIRSNDETLGFFNFMITGTGK